MTGRPGNNNDNAGGTGPNCGDNTYMNAQHTRRDVIRMGIGLVVVGGAVASCGSDSDASGDPKDVKDLTIFLSPGPTEDAVKKLIPDYEKATGITINVVDAPYDAAHQKQLLSFKSGRGAYDIVQFDNPFLAVYASQKVLAPLDDRLASSKLFDPTDFVQPLLDYGKFNGVTYGLDLSTEPFLMWYRKDIYEDLGLTIPATWDEYYANAQAIQDSGTAAGQIIANANPVNSWWWLQLLWSFGGDLTDASGAPTVNTPQAQQATDYMVKLLEVSPESAISSNGDDATSLFITQNVGQMINYSGYYPTITDPAQSKFVEQIGYASVPGATTDIVQLTGWNIGIPADSKKQDAAWAFLEWLIGKDGTKRLIAAGGAAIGRNSVAADEALTTQYPYLKLLVPAAQSGRRLPAMVQWPEVSNQIGVRVADILTGTSSTADGLASLQSDLSATLGK